MTLGLTTAGESHGPALVAIVTGLPAGRVVDHFGSGKPARSPHADELVRRLRARAQATLLATP